MTDHDQKPRLFPILQQSRYSGPAHPTAIPWEVAGLAHSDYRKKNSNDQTLEQLAQRGGFSPGEMDVHLPDWRERCDVIAALRAERAAALARVKEVEGEEWYQQMIARAEGAESALCQCDHYNSHLEEERDALKADNERLRGLVKSAFEEGVREGWYNPDELITNLWEASQSRKERSQ